MRKIVVVGAGYVGLTTAVHLVGLGHTVCCVENDSAKCEQIKAGEVPWHEPGLADALHAARQTGRWMIVETIESALCEVDLVVVAVGTPEGKDGSLDLSVVERAVSQVANKITYSLPIAIKSTVTVGTCRRLQQEIDLQNTGCRIVSWPEFLREGSALHDLRYPDRIVVGTQDIADAQLIFSLDPSMAERGIATTWEAAELGKMASNAFLATKIAFTHELAAVCETNHVSIDEVVRIIGSDRRIGHWGLEAGIGFGGSCFPKDLNAFSQFTPTNRPSVTRGALQVNKMQVDRLLGRLKRFLHIGKGTPVTVLGLAYKTETDDIRESPSIELVEALLALGAEVTVHDPRAMPAATARLGRRVSYAPSVEAAVSGAQLCVVSVGWKGYVDLDAEWFIGHLPSGCVVVDVRRIWLRVQQTGVFTYLAVGVDEKTYTHAPPC